MSSNINIYTALTIQATDIVAGTTPYNLALSGIILPVTAWSSSDFFQVGTGTTVIPLPAAVVFYAFVRNLGTNPVALTVTYPTQAPTTMILNPVTTGFGAWFQYGNTIETSPAGISAMSATTTPAANPIQYFVAA
jgi:hypothetical protein